ncbi:interleukin-1 receptor type 1-like [Symphorus nematophorus]
MSQRQSVLFTVSCQEFDRETERLGLEGNPRSSKVRTRTMAAAGWVFSLATLLSLAFSVAHNHSGETDTYHVSVGHLFALRCLIGDAHTNVTWTRGGRHNLGPLPTGVEVRDGLLLFLPVQLSHDGSYACETRDQTGKSMTFGVSVSSGDCPDPPENISIQKGLNDGLPCKQDEIFRLNNTRTIRWMKDCKPVERKGEPIYVNDKGFMRLPGASEEDAGKYTCLIDISLDGKMYTSARSIQLTINDGLPEIIYEPEVVYPQKKVVIVEVGNVHDGDSVFIKSILSISEVLGQFLNVPIRCHVENPAISKYGLLLLQEADHSALHTSVALCLAASLAIVALPAAFLLFKVDLVLAYRKLLRHLSKQQTQDGKLYDAYVSYLDPDTLSSTETVSFALQILPEELEKQHGYSLYIRGRDDCPGEAVHDIIAATVRQCRRLIIILSPATKCSTHGNEAEELLSNNQNQLWSYEQKIGLYDALTQNDPRVILVEIDGPVDYSCLPESLRYIKRKQGSLKWKKPSLGTHKLTKLCSNRNFWKNLRYYMPSVPSGTLQTIV